MTIYLIAGVVWLIAIPVMTGALMRSNEGNLPGWLIYTLGIIWPATIVLLLALTVIAIGVFIIQKLFDFGYWIAGVLEHLD